MAVNLLSMTFQSLPQTLAAAALAALLAAAGPTGAQEGFDLDVDEGFEIDAGGTADEGFEIDQSPLGEALGASYFERHFSGSFISYYAGLIDDKSERYNIQGRLRFDDEIDRYKFAAELRAYSSEVRVNFDLKDSEGNERDNNLTFANSQIELLEGYVDIDFDKVDLSLGRRRIVFGQFDFLSPVDLLLPIDFSGSSFSLSRVDNRLPQLAASATFYSGPFEFQAHYFPTLIIDALADDVNNFNVNYIGRNGEDARAPFVKPEDESQSALRLVYTGPHFTFGATLYRGYPSFANDFYRLIDDADPQTLGFTPLCRAEEGGNPPLYGSDGTGCALYTEPRPRLNEREALGLELSVPLGELAIKVELTQEKEIQDIDANFFPLEGSPGNDLHNPALADFRNWIISDNGGRLWLERDYMIVGLGVDWNSELWTLNAALISAIPSYSGSNKTGVDLAERADVLDGPEISSASFPTLNVLRRFGEDRKQSFGVALGLVGFAAGLTAYWINDTKENLQYGASLDVFQYLGDNQYENQGSENPDESSSIDDTPLPSIRLFVRYQF